MAGAQQPNTFLLENTHDSTCFCLQCRQQSYQRVTVLRPDTDWLHDMCVNVLPFGREVRSNVVFSTTLKQIVYGKVYREACLAGTTYVYWKCWAKTQDQFRHMAGGNGNLKKQFERIASDVNDAVY